jgi:hypothetical protein
MGRLTLYFGKTSIPEDKYGKYFITGKVAGGNAVRLTELRGPNR